MKKDKKILILVISSLLPLLFTATIPFALPTKLHVDSILMSEHNGVNGIKMYVVSLEEESQYTIVIDTDIFWGMETSLRIGESPYMMNGLLVESGSYGGERMYFTASKTGDYYIQVKTISGSGFFDIWVDSGTIGPATGSNREFFNVSYLLVLVLPSVFIFAVGLLILRRRATRPEKQPSINIYRKIKKEEDGVLGGEKDVMICEHCGVEINKHLKKCPNCQTVLK